MNVLVKLNLVEYWKFYLENCTINFNVASKGVGKFPDNCSRAVGQLRRSKVFEISREGTRVLKIR